jgi:hypothetical protein
MELRALAVVWGLLEATLFFIVPDVLLSLVAVQKPGNALKLSLWVVAGSLVGGALMYGWGLHNPEQALAAVDRVPAISASMVDGVATDLERQGLVATVWGAWRGVPYKVYAAQASSVGFGLGAFLMITVPARLLRFLAIIALARFLARSMPNAWTPAQRRRCLAALWMIFYTGFFLLMPN